MDEKEHEDHIEFEKTAEVALGEAGNGLSNEEYAKRERAVVWKLDCFIAPVMMLLMLISYLDRGNVRALSSKNSTSLLTWCRSIEDWVRSHAGPQH